MVGEIQQPLHAGFAEDHGGNSVDVRFNGRKENLHSLWDNGLVDEEGLAYDPRSACYAAAAGVEITLGDIPVTQI